MLGLVWFEHILLNLFQRDWAQVLKLISPSPSASGEEDENVKFTTTTTTPTTTTTTTTTDNGQIVIRKAHVSLRLRWAKKKKEALPDEEWKENHIYLWWTFLLKLDEKSTQIAQFIDLIPNWGDILTSYMNVFNSLLIRSNLCTLYRQVYQEVKNKTSILKRKLRYFIIIFFIKKKEVLPDEE